MKLRAVFGVIGIIGLALAAGGCSPLGGSGAEAKVPVSTTTLTNAPMTPDLLLPAVVWEEDELTEPFTRPAETWGVKPATDEELAKYGF